MTCRVAIIHYTPPGIVGGAEHVIHQHVRLLESRGFDVTVIAGRDDGASVPVHVIPEINAATPDNIRIDDELQQGVVGPMFTGARERIRSALLHLLSDVDVVVAHNVFTLHFCLPLTSVLWEVSWRLPRVLAWSHDLAWTNPLYLSAMYEGWPWNLLRMPAPGVRYVTVSEERRAELASLWHEGGDDITVIPNGIDPFTFLRLSDETRAVVSRHHLFDRDLVLLLPVRITRRKNIEAAIRAVAALKGRGMDVRFLITGPQAPHHPNRSNTYLDELKTLCGALDVEDEVVFLTEDLGHVLDEQTVTELYAVSHVLLFPSAQEGFGLPILEAGLARTPAVLSDLPIFREVSEGDARFFDPSADADKIADEIQAAAEAPGSQLYRRVLATYRWDAIVDDRLVPLLVGAGSEGKDET